MEAIYELGEITCPSGELVIVDGGHLGMWSGERSPAEVDPAAFGVQDPDVAAGITGATDFAITGPDAAGAAHSFDRQPGRMLHDIPAQGAGRLRELFDAHCRQHGFTARLEPCPERVPHRERVRRCVAEGGGAFLMNGVPVVALGGLPTDRPLPVLASGAGLVVPVSPAPVAKCVELGDIRVDWARILFGDADALSRWQHDEPVDGLADVAFWGASEEAAAEEFGAPALGEPGEDGVRGWTGLPLPEAARRAGALLGWKDADPARRMMVDFRPHSHHWQVMRQVRASAVEAGTVEVGGARMLCTMTGQGDGWFPVSADLGPSGELVAVRVSFAV
ncbi:hypothetical protein [Streptomyces fructofermentans]|uniref:hypothetical protein n=1 Tax=Streptomyces fructofermentans TaxID=152141 RepID=UPI0033F01D89